MIKISKPAKSKPTPQYDAVNVTVFEELVF